MKLLAYLFLAPLCFFAQSPVIGIVVDKETKKPLELVDVVAEDTYTSTNVEGKFEIDTSGRTISFNLIGYEEFSKDFELLSRPLDTVFLESKFLELDEVIVTNKEFSLADFIRIGVNYPFEPFTEAFFMRAHLTKNDSILKLQDIS
ncbi:hypothetical protein MNBD_BACTEROID03-1723, partial [hydrothermal vent metagenome]